MTIHRAYRAARSARAVRSVRSAGLVAVAAAAAFSLTACQSGDKDAAGPEKKDSVSASHSPGKSDAGNDSKSDAGKNRTSTQDEASTADHTDTGPTKGKSASPVRTETLADGSTAKIYQLGEQHYRAKVIADGEVFVTLETDGHDAGLDANDMFIVLSLDGRIHSWMGGGHQGPGTFKLEGGWMAKVTKLGELRYRAQILGNEGEVDATLETDGHDVGLNANDSYIVLSNGGVISSHE